jgi:hypothetical protein
MQVILQFCSSANFGLDKKILLKKEKVKAGFTPFTPFIIP